MIHFQLICIHSYAPHCSIKGIWCVFISVRLFPLVFKGLCRTTLRSSNFGLSKFIHEFGFLSREDSKSKQLMSSTRFSTLVYSWCVHVGK